MGLVAGSRDYTEVDRYRGRFVASPTLQIRTVLADRGISHIVKCPNLSWIPLVERTSDNTLYGDLVRGNNPAWAVPVEPPADTLEIKVFGVISIP